MSSVPTGAAIILLDMISEPISLKQVASKFSLPAGCVMNSAPAELPPKSYTTSAVMICPMMAPAPSVALATAPPELLLCALSEVNVSVVVLLATDVPVTVISGVVSGLFDYFQMCHRGKKYAIQQRRCRLRQYCLRIASRTGFLLWQSR